MKVESTLRRKAPFDRESHELVPERDPGRIDDQHPGSDTLVDERRRRFGQRLEEPWLDVLRNDRSGTDQLPGFPAEPHGTREHGICDRGGYRFLAGRQHLDDEEGIAAGPAVELLVVEHRSRRQLRDRGARQWPETESPDGTARRELAEHAPEGVVGRELIAVAREHECGDALDSPCEQAEDIERCLVGPVDVVEDEDGSWPTRELVRERRRDLVRLSAFPQQLLQRTIGPLGRCEERPERPRREERIAGSPQHPGRILSLDERPEEARLADAGLAGDEQQLPGAAAANSRERLLEELELGAALDERRSWTGCGRACHVSWCTNKPPRLKQPLTNPVTLRYLKIGGRWRDHAPVDS